MSASLGILSLYPIHVWHLLLVNNGPNCRLRQVPHQTTLGQARKAEAANRSSANLAIPDHAGL
jgi:hypothetical protein